MAESVEHEQLVGLFRDRKELVRELLEPLGIEILGEPSAEPDESDLSDPKPVLGRADLVRLYREGEDVRMAVIVEVQLAPDPEKHLRWPQYYMALRVRHRCPVALVVVAPKASVADWARKPIPLDSHASFTPIVIGPSQIPRPQSANAPQEQLLLAVRAHPDPDVAMVALEAVDRLPTDERTEYIDTLLSLLPGEVRKEILDMVTTRARLYPASDFAKEHYGKGHAEGREEGREEGLRQGQSELLLLLLSERFGELPSELTERVRSADAQQLLSWGRKVLTASALADVFKD